MQKWILYTKRADFQEIGRQFQIDPVTARIIRNRGLSEYDDINLYLNGTRQDLYDPNRMLNLSKAVAMLIEAVSEGKSIRIIGDYDIDGICSIYILFQGLLRIGATVDYEVPDRVADGYGINVKLVEDAHQAGRSVILTCDNGIAAGEAIKRGKELGMTMIVTDHHEVPYVDAEEGRKYILPEADLIVDPKQPNETYPFRELCGAGIAFKLVSLLYEKCRVPESELDELLGFAAIATIGDIVDLMDENRILVKEGLKQLHQTKNEGLNALIDLTGANKATLGTYQIGFVIGPCLNASGRLDTAKRAIRMLCEKDRGEAQKLAGDLKSLNDERKVKTNEAVKAGIQFIEDNHMQNDQVQVVYLPDCHESVAGIVAGKIREKYYRPTIVLTKAKEGVKGSARSIEEYNIFEKLTQAKHLLTKFGGHAMAAGLSLEESKIDELRAFLNEQAMLTEEDLTEKVHIDVPMPLEYVSENLILDLQKLAPHGKANAKPIFADKNISVYSIQTMGKQGEFTRMVLSKGDHFFIDAVGFFPATELIQAKEEGRLIDCTYEPQINEFRGVKKLQISITGYRIQV